MPWCQRVPWYDYPRHVVLVVMGNSVMRFDPNLAPVLLVKVWLTMTLLEQSYYTMPQNNDTKYYHY